MSNVTSPPSSTTSSGPLLPGNVTASSVQSQYSSSVSPFHANTGVPVFAIAAAAWSCVEKILHEAQRTEAPRSFSVSISTAVWIVMCSEPVTRTPLSGLVAAYFLRIDIKPGISCSAISISLRPQSASDRSATLKSSVDLRTAFIGVAPLCWRAPLRVLIPAERRGGFPLQRPSAGGEGRLLYRFFAMEGYMCSGAFEFGDF